MSTITTPDGTQINHKDWGTGQVLQFHQSHLMAERASSIEAYIE
jgi:hypothetical protein